MRTVPLGKLTSLISSGSTPLGGANVYLESGPVMLVRSQNVLMRELNLDDVAFITEETAERMKRTVVHKNDVLLNITGASIGRVSTIEIEKVKANVNQHVCIIRSIPELLDHRYLLHFIAQPKFQNQINSTQHGGTRQALTFAQIRNFQIPLPPLEEQRRIAAILDKADAVRRKRKEAIRLTEDLLRSAFLEMFGDPVTNPKEWEVINLSELIQGDVRNGLSPSNSGTYQGNVLTLSAITQGKFDINARKDAHFEISPPKEKMVCKSVFLTCRGNGNISLVGCGRFPDKDYGNVMFPDTMIAVPINFLMVERCFFEYLWNGPFVRHQIEKQARTTNGTYKINQKILQDLEILLPPIELQKEFTDIHSKIQSLKVNCRPEDLSDLFNSLLQRAFCGEL